MADANTANEPAAEPRSFSSFFWRRLPFLAVLALAITGVAYMNLLNQPLTGYWEFMAIATCLLCLITGWEKAATKEARIRLIWKQVLHWAAILVTMYIVLMSTVQQMLPSPATSLVLLTLLALGTFLAGVGLESLQICFLGLAMALAVPAIAWFKQSALFLFLATMLVLGLAVAFLPRRFIKGASSDPEEA